MRYSDSTAVFKKINSIKNLAKKAKDDDLLLETELMILHYYVFKDRFSKDFTVKKIKALADIAKKDKVLWLEIRTLSLLANYLYSEHKEYGLGFEYYEKTAKLLESITIEDFPLKQICLYQIAHVHNEFKEYKKAINYLKRAKDLKSKYNSEYYTPHIYNTLGDSYAQLNQIDSSNHYFKINLKRATQLGDSIWIGISSGNLGTNYLNQRNYNKALPFLKNSIRITENAKDWSFTSGRLSDLGLVYLGLNNLTDAKEAAIKANDYAIKSKAYYRLLNLFKLQSNIAAYEFKPEIASQYLDSLVIVKDSLAKIFNGTKLVRAKQRIALEKQLLKEEKEKLKNFKKIIIRNTLIVLLGVLLILMFIRYSKNKKTALEKEEKMLLEKDNAEKKLNIASLKLKEFTTSFIDKNKKIEALEKLIKDTSETKENDTKEVKIKINQLRKSSILTDEEWDNFVNIFNQVYPIFFNNLKINYPKITPSETRLLALSKLELENKQMALMLGVGANAIRQIKSRFLKKYAVKTDTKLIEIINKL
ncbi:tetratricopeptide repeat protein [Polaribacter porphyrae]|uniref:Uncharacterized protein n=1 Tax=Polaribacter porphyrae TaxID=1137780 RepID=A0A2S7WML0_9FLAO|nr:tetratricopeptide repeat protein [Polaribacter porphyrae]PQJ78696.1 hypothetical protein BTO18_05630 [Polaribacter porphyrae]